MGYIVQSSSDGGETWDACSVLYKTDGEAVAKKREIENHVGEDSLVIELRVVERGFYVRQEGGGLYVGQEVADYRIYEFPDKDLTRYPCPYDKEKYLKHPEREQEIGWLWCNSIPWAWEVEICPHEVLIRVFGGTSDETWLEIEKIIQELLNQIPE